MPYLLLLFLWLICGCVAQKWLSSCQEFYGGSASAAHSGTRFLLIFLKWFMDLGHIIFSSPFMFY